MIAPVYAALGALLLWLLLLTFFLIKTTRHYKRLTQATHKDTLDSMLNALLDQGKSQNKDIEILKNAVQELDAARHTYFQRFGYVKFNPFEDRVGGEQSFVIALLDNKKNGLVKTFMYTRDGVRVYVKPIKDGKCDDYELSHEEQEAIRNAS
jgi:hypothetical protein